MKTIEELYNDIIASEELQKALSQISDQTALADFLKEHGCEAAAEEFVEFIKSQGEGEIGDDAAAETAGGFPTQYLELLKKYPIRPQIQPGPIPGRRPIA